MKTVNRSRGVIAFMLAGLDTARVSDAGKTRRRKWRFTSVKTPSSDPLPTMWSRHNGKVNWTPVRFPASPSAISFCSECGHQRRWLARPPLPFLKVVNSNGDTFTESENGVGVDNWMGLLRRISPAQSEDGWLLFDVPTNSYKLRVTDGA